MGAAEKKTDFSIFYRLRPVELVWFKQEAESEDFRCHSLCHGMNFSETFLATLFQATKYFMVWIAQQDQEEEEEEGGVEDEEVEVDEEGVMQSGDFPCRKCPWE